jgi:hypothetical protein
MKVNERGAVIGMYGGEEKCIQVSWRNMRERAAWKT